MCICVWNSRTMVLMVVMMLLQSEDDDYVVDHSIVMYLMNRDGECVEFFPQLIEAPEIADRVTRVMRKDLSLDRWDPVGWLARLFGGSSSSSSGSASRAPQPPAPKASVGDRA